MLFRFFVSLECAKDYSDTKKTYRQSNKADYTVGSF